ncbi:type I DNA topoisomerase [Candidatus Phytoplasma pini]|uniref:DNA topoisomerase 1 n=1 Tax=Candidatus Phytoplasma pini TaxID=267362 RepID=A0A559KJB2_9MOLU|nr:type I DNA topoisomerase [Candidatus Phytoplasma pini]TVY12225.1 DNA topoisomerase [Candidatus Phytoplasma pini]
MKKKPVIILESPSKAKTISSFFENKVLVLCSKGHIRDLSLEGEGNLGIDIANGFRPSYIIIPKQKELVKNLIQKTKDKNVFLATDSDREGESIAWHLSEILNLKTTDLNRIVFNEITKDVVLKAFQNPSCINKALVDSQETRRILDRIIGFRLSYLVKKIKSKSAGRVQSVALKIIVDLEDEIKKFIPEEYYLINAIFDFFQANLTFQPKDKKIKKTEALEIFEKIKNKKFLLKNKKKEKSFNQPPKPFITSTLQQDCFRDLSFSAKKTMNIAQKLYEGIQIEKERIGLITYMRTDSFRISSIFIQTTQNFIVKEYGKKYVGIYKEIKNTNSQDAHEAIRPTDIYRTPAKMKKYLDKYEFALYQKVYSRTLSSLMSYACFFKTQLIFVVDKYLFEANGKEMIFDGYYKGLGDSFKNTFLPDLELNQFYLPKEIKMIDKMTNPPARFTEASLIKKLEKLKIGRPSTYANIIEILKKRFYVIIKDKEIFPTEIGISTKIILEKFFPSIINIQYTSQVEEKLDLISEKKIEKKFFLKEFYDDFQKLLDIANQQIKRIKQVTTYEKCNLCRGIMLKRKGKYGLFLGCSNFPKCKNIMSLKNKY